LNGSPGSLECHGFRYANTDIVLICRSHHIVVRQRKAEDMEFGISSSVWGSSGNSLLFLLNLGE